MLNKTRRCRELEINRKLNNSDISRHLPNSFKMNNIESKYDEVGVLKTKPWPDIKKGDKVQYIDARRVGTKRLFKYLFGIWDGEKVEFKDDQNTIVRTTRWLSTIHKIK